MDALNILLLKHVEYEHDFKRNMKHFVALHRAIEHEHASPFVISWLADIYPELKQGQQQHLLKKDETISEDQSSDGKSLKPFTPKDISQVQSNYEISFQVIFS